MSKIEESFQKIYNRLIPIVIFFPVLFLVIFIVVSMIQLREINIRIEEGQSQTVKSIFERLIDDETLSVEELQFLSLAVLEEESLSERYRQGHYSLVSRSFKQFLGFFTGIIMVIVGSVFVLLKLKEDVGLDSAHGQSWKVSLVTSSPGVAFAVLGSILISIASMTNDKISVRDSGLYLTREYLVAPFFGNSNTSSEENTEGLENYLRDQSEKGEKLIVSHPPQIIPSDSLTSDRLNTGQ